MIPVVLSGGSGTRLWPVSRLAYPKQFCEFYDQSFLANTIGRVQEFGEPHVLTVASMKSLTGRTLKDMGLPESNAIYEPYGKNTAPAIALLCHYLQQNDKGSEIVGIFPADHMITSHDVFVDAVKLGAECAEKGDVVTLGIKPAFASTGYGYIEVQDSIICKGNGLNAHMVTGFREKPNENTAQKFLDAGNYYWNAGMFIFRVDVMVEHFKKFLPDMWKRIVTIKHDLSNAKYAYANLESVSIDYGIMEKLDRQVCIPGNLGWSDVGSWDEVARLAEEHPALRAGSRGEVFLEDANQNFAFSIRNKVMGFVGVDNLIVVDTPDALLVTRKGKSEGVKALVEQMKHAGATVAIEHPFEMRPWGGFEVLTDDKDYKTKKITVDPGARLSYQSHEKRSEHWVVVSGEAEVTLDDQVHALKPGQAIHIPRQAKHRIKNPGAIPLVFIEVQTGQYFGEDDITRYQDDYSRA